VTLGHVVIAQLPMTAHVFNHEMIHVRQYEVYGPAFIPAYLLSCVRHGALNKFEQEAYRNQHDPDYRRKKG
jgi:hypothetical protein